MPFYMPYRVQKKQQQSYMTYLYVPYMPYMVQKKQQQPYMTYLYAFLYALYSSKKATTALYDLLICLLICLI